MCSPSCARIILFKKRKGIEQFLSYFIHQNHSKCWTHIKPPLFSPHLPWSFCENINWPCIFKHGVPYYKCLTYSSWSFCNWKVVYSCALKRIFKSLNRYDVQQNDSQDKINKRNWRKRNGLGCINLLRHGRVCLK